MLKDMMEKHNVKQEVVLTDELTSESGYRQFDVVMDDMIEKVGDVADLLIFETAVIMEEDSEKLMEMYSQMPNFLEEGITSESAVNGKSGFLNKVGALKDKIISNIEENSTMVLDILKNNIGDSVSSFEALREKIAKSESNGLTKPILGSETTINNYCGVFTAMGLDINNTSDVIKFINMPRNLMVPLFKEQIQFIKSLNDSGKNKTAEKIMLGDIPKGKMTNEFFRSLKNVDLKDLDIYYGFPIKLTGINCSFATVHLAGNNKKYLQLEVDAVKQKNQIPNLVNKEDALKIIDECIKMIKDNQGLNSEVKNMISEISKFLAFFRAFGSTSWSSFNPLDGNFIQGAKSTIGFYGTFTLSGKLTQHYLVATKNLAKSNWDMKNFVSAIVTTRYKW